MTNITIIDNSSAFRKIRSSVEKPTPPRDIVKSEIPPIQKALNYNPKEKDFSEKTKKTIFFFGGSYKAARIIEHVNGGAVASARHLATALQEGKIAPSQKNKVLGAIEALDTKFAEELKIDMNGGSKLSQGVSKRLFNQSLDMERIKTAARSYYPSDNNRSRFVKELMAVVKKARADGKAAVAFTTRGVSLLSSQARIKDGTPVLDALVVDKEALESKELTVSKRYRLDILAANGGLDPSSHITKLASRSVGSPLNRECVAQISQESQQRVVLRYALNDSVKTGLEQGIVDRLTAKYPGIAKLHDKLRQLRKRAEFLDYSSNTKGGRSKIDRESKDVYRKVYGIITDGKDRSDFNIADKWKYGMKPLVWKNS